MCGRVDYAEPSFASSRMKPPPPLKKRMAPPPPAPSPASSRGPTPTGLVSAVIQAPRSNKPMPPPRTGQAGLVPPPAASQPRPDRSGDWVVGNLLDGRFHVDGVLGEGGMGTVYAGKDGVDGRRVAIKILRSDFLSDSEIVQRFLNEAQAASQIGSPHICSVFGIGSAPNGAAYFVMEFLDGQSLATLLERERVLAIRRILRIGHQIAVGLSAAHASGIIHRDLKPDNIMLIARGEQPEFAKILDFGVAKIGSSHSKLTRAGSVFGTPQYMSPEQAAGSPVDPRADVYSLGIILYEMAAGMVPFDDENMMNVLTHQMFRDPLAVRDVAPQVVPQEFNAIVRKCLQKDPKLRFESMQALADELQRTAGVLPEGQFETVIPDSKRPFSDQGPRGLSATVPELPRIQRVSKIAYVAAGVAAALVCGIAGVVAYTQRESHEISADMAEVTPAMGASMAPPEARPITLALSPAHAVVTGAVERSKTIVENEQRLVLELPPGAKPVLRVAAPGYVDQVVDVNPSLGNAFVIALRSSAPAEPADPAPVASHPLPPKRGGKGPSAAGKAAPPPPASPVVPAAKPCPPKTSPLYNPFDCDAR